MMLVIAAAYGFAAMAGATTTTPAALNQTRHLWRDTFVKPLRYERRPAYAWLPGGVFRAAAETAMLLPPLAPLEQSRTSARLTVKQRVGSAWTYAGIGAYLDPGNSWQLLLVEGPDGNRYFELLEEYGGLRQAQSARGELTELPEEASGDLDAWEPQKPYELTLSLDADHVEGVIRDPVTGRRWRRAYSFGARRAVRQGRPAVIAAGTHGVVNEFTVEAQPSPPGKHLAVRAGKAGSAVILKARRGDVAERLGKELTRAGLGVTVVGWDDLNGRRLPPGKVDLFVLADARSLPLSARDEVDRLLCSGGRVLAIGAPGGSELLARTPEGWTDRQGWVQSRAKRLRREPLTVAEGEWRRSAYRLTQPAAIALDTAEGSDCWKTTTDLLGWDGWYAEAAGAFGPDRRLLVFEARGDATTTALAVECVEEDGSRWMATVPLTTDWRWHVLGPGDFAYWTDSPTKNRGHAGDGFRPGRLARISFGLSSSHTPRVKPGPHTYWLRSLATAHDAAGDTPDFRLTDVEALWPAYNLYPMGQISELRASSEQSIVPSGFRVAWKRPAYSPVWRERGRGFRRGRAWRWIPLIEAYDGEGRKRGALLSLAVGDGSLPNAMWANLAVSDPVQALRPELLRHLVATAAAMARGVCLLEGGAEFFSYRPGEGVRLGARALNAGRTAERLTTEVRVTDAGGAVAFSARRTMAAPAGQVAEAAWTWRPTRFDAKGYTVATTLFDGSKPLDRIVHRVEAIRTTPARPEEYVRVEGSMFTLGGEPWYFQGINYWPTWMAGYPNLNQRSRECYDPEIIERDLKWLKSAGVTVLSAIAAIQPPSPEDPDAYRDQLDFLDRCLRHGIRCYVTLHTGRAYAGADFARLKQYIERSGLRDHPAVMCWELAWEPIEGAWGKDLEKFVPDWNRWVVERYGTTEAAVRDWGFDPRPSTSGPVPSPTSQQCLASGQWNGFVAAFSRAFSDLISRAYGKVVRPLRAWNPNRLISFRGGACGIPSGQAFAHIHSVGVARHLDFLCPEGYNLQTGGWALPTPADDIRKGGLVTAYYRFVSREKPVVWMEFGYTLNGFGEAWSPERLRVKAEEYERQRIENERFYAMIIESGSRGAAPWWLPGGFRLGENSDFGYLEPDGSERPVCDVFRAYQPRFADVRHPEPDAMLTIDVDGERANAWQAYSSQYLDLLKAGRTPGLRTDGTGTDSSNCPLVSVTGTPCNGHNPPRFLNAEFDRLEVKLGDGPWHEASDGAVLEAPAGAQVRCRAAVGNIGEAAWLASAAQGAVRLAGRSEYGLAFAAPIRADTPYLAAAEVSQFTLVPSLDREVTVSFEMEAQGRAWFGERRTVTLRPK